MKFCALLLPFPPIRYDMFLLLSLLCFFHFPAVAGIEVLPEKEFRILAAEMANKVNLFREVWTQDPEAEFYGGTSRDFLYWLKGKFTEAHSRDDAEKVIANLRQMPVIDVQSFIVGDSDIDLISSKRLTLTAQDFGVRKIDIQPTDIFDPQSEAGFNEFHQGYAPAEKIRLGQKGVVDFPTLGNGLQEIYRGKLTVHFASAEDFAQTKFAQEKLNHPTLLALRYLRLLAINYFRTHGRGYPDLQKLQDSIDPESADVVRNIIDNAIHTDVLESYLINDKFKSWANGSIQKAFRSYTNPTAALRLMEMFKVDQLVRRFSTKLDPINQYVFVKHRDLPTIAGNF